MFTKTLILFQKVSTRLTGLDVVHNPQTVLKKLYDRTMKVLAEMPNGYQYRISTEAIIQDRLNKLNLIDIEEIERKINCGQIEEVILQAENELNLAKNILTWKAWEPLEEEPLPNQWKWPL